MKKIFLFFSTLIFALFGCFSIFSFQNIAFAKEEPELAKWAKSALLYDVKSGCTIFEKNADKRLPIASMTKIASLSLIFDAIERGELDENTMVKISHHSAETEGSSAFLDEKSEYKVGELIKTVIICSANDSTVALAEKVAGSEDEFVRQMNNKARELNLTNTSFVNCTGLPAVDHYSSARDVAKFYELICGNSIYRKYSKIWMTDLVHPSGRKTDIVNTNRLIKSYEGCDSGKTGFTNDAGYCLSASAVRGEMRLVGVVIGEKDSKVRFNEMAEMFDYGFNNFESKVVLSKNQALDIASVKASKQKTAVVYPKTDYVRFLRKGEQFDYSLQLEIASLKAPIKNGEEVGKLYVLDKNNIVVCEMPLVVHEDIAKIKFKDIFQKIIKKI